MSRNHRTARAGAALLGLGSVLAVAACSGNAPTATTPTAPPTAAAARPAGVADPTPAGAAPVRAAAAQRKTAPSRSSATGTRTTKTHAGSGAATTTTYAELVSAWRATPAGYALEYDKLDRLTGQAAIDYQLKSDPYDDPYSDAYRNDNPKLRLVVLWPKAVIHGNQELGPGNGNQTAKLTPDQLVDRATKHPRALVKMIMKTIDGRVQVVRLDEIYDA